MGVHGFTTNPEQMADEEDDHDSDLIRQVGIAEGWDMPLAEWLSPPLEDDASPPFMHHTLCIHLRGPTLCRIWRDGSRTLYGYRQGAILPAGEGPCRWRAEGGLQFRHIYFRPEMLARLAEETHDAAIAGGLTNRNGSTFDGELAAMVHSYACRAVDTTDPPSMLEMDSYATIIGLHLIRHHGEQLPARASSKERVTPLLTWRLRRVQEYVEASLGDPLRLEKLAALAGLSPYHFARSFKAATGITVHRYVQERRLERACEALRATDLPISQIAILHGFASHAHFTSFFRTRTGTTPARFRREG